MMRLIIGLGNPGQEYKNTRHNFGWLVLDALTKDWKFSKKFKADLAEFPPPAAGRASQQKIIFAKPQTYMNESGTSVRLLASYYKLKFDKPQPGADQPMAGISGLLAIHDDLDLPLGTLKLSTNSGAA